MSLPPWLLYNFSPEEEGVGGMGALKELRMGLGGGEGKGRPMWKASLSGRGGFTQLRLHPVSNPQHIFISWLLLSLPFNCTLILF